MNIEWGKRNTMSIIRCPRCQSEAFYKYGHTQNGKKRYICLLCNRQFIHGDSHNQIIERPECALCGNKMHVYMRDAKAIRFRCSGYPQCRGYAKILQEA